MSETAPHSKAGKGGYGKIGNILLKVVAIFVILEPIWMVMPFAGMLYSSALPVEAMSQSLSLSWLVKFILPTHSLFPLGLVMMFVGLSIFAVGASQIYYAKFKKRGMVRKGIYRYFRHPQYVALTVFSVGIILTWGRFISYLAFFLMLWLYLWLSKSEESICEDLFGDEYREYRKTTWFLFPGESLVFGKFAKFSLSGIPKEYAMILTFVVIMGIGLGSGFGILALREAHRSSVPGFTGALDFTLMPAYRNNIGPNDAVFVMVYGPGLQAMPPSAPVMKMDYMEKAQEALMSSSKVLQALYDLQPGQGKMVLAFITPGEGWHSGAHADPMTSRFDAFFAVLDTPVRYNGRNFAECRDNWRVLNVVRVIDVCYGRYAAGQDAVEGEVSVGGPPPGRPESPELRARTNDRISFFLSGLR